MKKLVMSPLYTMGRNNGINKKGDVKNHLFHVVNDGETLSSIAHEVKSSQDELKKLNGLKNDKIYLGQVFKLYICKNNRI